MPMSTSLALVPVNARTDARFNALSDELLYAWDRTDSGVARQWGVSTAALFGTSLKRRATNLFKLAGRFTVVAAAENISAVNAYRHDRLASHLGHRVGAAYASGSGLVTRVKVATSQAAQLVQSQPRESVPQLLVLVATSLLISGGPDGDGGAPDLDLMFGIDAHRSVLTHSVLIGAALETALLSMVNLVRLIHAKLPADHDPLWDSLAKHADSVGHTANAGISIGTSYHLFVDGLLQPAAYHDIPVSMPMEAHQTIFAVNAAAEAVDVANKPGSEERATLTQRKASHQPRARASAPAPSTAGPAHIAPLALQPPTLPWWETASTPELAAAKEEHQRLRTETILVDPFVADMLADAELVIIERYGSWLGGLANGTLRPLSAAQERFVQVAKQQRPPETAHEQAWVMYQGLLEYAPTARSSR